MAFDGIAVSVITQELSTNLVNARLMKIYQIDKHTIVLNLRTPGSNQKLVISADPVHPRIHTTAQEFDNPLNPPAFCMLLRKHLEPSRILAIEQLELERLIIITFEVYDEEFGRTENYLVFELMGRHSNIILLNHDKIILDAIHRSSNEDHLRQIMPKIKYDIPQNQTKFDIRKQTQEEFINEVRLLPANLSIAKGLIELYQGLGPQTSAEIVRRAKVDPKQLKQDTSMIEFQALWHGFTDLLTNGGSPVLVENRGLNDFFAYSLTGVENQTAYESFDKLLDDFYSTKIHKQQLQQQAAVLNRVLATHLKRVIKKETLQRETLKKAETADKWQKLGELILANIHNISKGMDQVEVVDYYDPDQNLITISLDKSLSASENAQRFFKKYTKAKNSVKITKLQLQKTLNERSYIEETLFHIETADRIETLEEIKDELIKANYLNRKRAKITKTKKTAAPSYDQYISSDGIPILLGRNSRQNDQLTFKVARSDDLWFHAQKIAGSHVIVKTSGNVPDQTILEAATLAAYYSKSKNSPKVPVDYTERKHVKKPAAATPGFVIYNIFKTITVDPTDDRNLPKKKKA